MRNLKKVLSLALALVMLLGMMVVGAGAATKFQDADEIQNKEAVAVLVGMGIMKGREDGTNFDPTGTLTRAEAAMMIAQMDLGVDAAAALKGNGSNTFSDVWAGYWAEGAIDYCVEQGYIKGDGAGHFLPGNPVSSVEFGSMALRLLGYDANNEGLVGSQWAVKAASLIRKAGLATSVAANTQPMTRDEMAQMAFNTLTAETVEYNGLNISGDNITITSPATVRRHSANQSHVNTTYDYESIKSNITPIRFCEERFPTLKLSRFDNLDEFGRRCSVWLYKGLKIAGSEATVVPNLAYNTKVTKDTVADWAKMEGLYPATKANNNDKPMELWINGQKMADFTQPKDDDKVTIDYTKKLQDWIAWYTAPGREVEVYMNKDDLSKVERVVVVDTVLAEVTKENTDETISVKLMKTPNDKVTTGSVTLNTKVGVGDVKKGDIVLVQGYYNGSTAEWRLNKDTTITSVEVAPIVTGFATFKGFSGKDKTSYIKVDGTDYKDAYSVVKDYTVQEFVLNDENLDCTLYLDNHGNIMKAVPGKDENAVKDNLIAVKENYDTLTNGKITHMVRGVISNGETVTWQVKDAVKDNGIYMWTDKTDGVYTLAPITGKTYSSTVATADKESWVATLSTKDTTNFKSNDVFGKDEAKTVMYSDTVKFIFVGKDSVTVLNGRQNYDLPAGKTLAQTFKDGEITAVFVNTDPDVVDVSGLIYIHSAYENNEQIVDVNGKQVKYWGYTAYDANGDEIEDFLGAAKDMEKSFQVAKKTDDGKAYVENYNNTTVKEHTMIKGVVAQANGISGDALVLVSAGDDGKIGTPDDVHYDFMGRKSTKVIDLTTAKLYIDSIPELNEAANGDKANGKPEYQVEVAVIFNATDSRAILPSKGTVREAVTVFVTGIHEKSADYPIPDHVATGVPDTGDSSTTEGYSVKSSLSGNDAVEFSKDNGANWSTVLSGLAENDVIWVRAKEQTAGDGAMLTGTPATLTFLDATTLQSEVVATEEVAGQAGVLKFTMPTKNLAVTGATSITYCKVVDGFVPAAENKVHLKVEGTGTRTDQALIKMAADFFKNNPGKANGYSIVDTSYKNAGAAVVAQFDLYKDGVKVGSSSLASTNIIADTDNIRVTVETKDGPVSVLTDGGTDHTQLGKILTWAGVDSGDITAIGTAAPLALIEKSGTTTTTAPIALADTTTVADGSTVRTNVVSGHYVGYVAINGVLTTTALSGASVLTAGSTPAIALSNADNKLITLDAATMKYAMKANDVPAASGTAIGLTVTLSHDKDDTLKTDASKAINATISSTGVVATGWATKTPIADLGSAATWAADKTFSNNFTLTNHGTPVNTITITLTLTWE